MAPSIPVVWNDAHRHHAPAPRGANGIRRGTATTPAGVDRLVEAARAHGSDALVVALGADAAVDDPNSPLAVTADGFREAGRRLGALGLPTVVVQEGGYVLDTVGRLVLAALEGLDETR